MAFIDRIQLDNVTYDIQSKDTEQLNGHPASDYVLKKDLSEELSGTLSDYALKTDLSKYVLIDDLFPIGSIYMNINNVNPSTLFGGEWSQIYGRFLLSASDKYPAGSEGGESEHTLTLDEIPSHKHTLNLGYGAGSLGNSVGRVDGNSPANRGWTMQTAGGGQSHNNMPPYLTVYMWKRIA